jgi:hypothetical protein
MLVAGRDRELAAIAAFLGVVDLAPRVLLIEGEAGIGTKPRRYVCVEC